MEQGLCCMLAARQDDDDDDEMKIDKGGNQQLNNEVKRLSAVKFFIKSKR